MSFSHRSVTFFRLVKDGSLICRAFVVFESTMQASRMVVIIFFILSFRVDYGLGQLTVYTDTPFTVGFFLQIKLEKYADLTKSSLRSISKLVGCLSEVIYCEGDE